MLKPDNNIAHVRTVARALGDLREDLVFVGGSVAGLLLSDPLAAGVRATIDVDAVTDSNRASLLELEQAIQTRGFIHDVMSGVICRWIHKESGVVFDLMPVDPNVLGFTNPWYAYAVQSAQLIDIGDGLRIKVVSAPAFIATKIEAFKSRGNSDFLTSHDFEDILNVVDGRPELIEELAAAPKAVQQLVAELFGGLLANSDFINTLPGLLPEPDRYEVVLQRLSEMAKL